MKTRKISMAFFLVATLYLIVTATPITRADDSSGAADGGVSFMPASSLLQGYKIAVTEAEGTNDEQLVSGLQVLGAEVSLIPLASITPGMLATFNLVWIPVGGSADIDNAGKADEILAYVSMGGNVIVSQPNQAGQTQCLPYQWEILSAPYSLPKAAVIVDLNHCLTIGLTVDDMPDNFDTIGAVGPEWTILARDQNGEPSFAFATYGQGKIVVEMDAPYPGADATGDDPCLSDAMVQRMVECLTSSIRSEPVGGELQVQNIPSMIAPYLLASVIVVGTLGLLKKRKWIRRAS